MKDLTSKLTMFTTNDNASLIDELVSIIIENDISSLEELRDLEDKYFPSDDMDNKIKYLYDEMIKDSYKFDNLDSKQIDLYDEMKDKFINSKSMAEKLVLIIKMYELLNYQLKLPYGCYCLIVSERL